MVPDWSPSCKWRYLKLSIVYVNFSVIVIRIDFYMIVIRD